MAMTNSWVLLLFMNFQGQRERGGRRNNSHLQLPSPGAAVSPLQDAQAGSLKACRQVYEIKALHTINNLAANHKKQKPKTLPVLYRSEAV